MIPGDLVRPAGILFGILVLLRLIAAQFPEERLWGLSFGAYIPLWTQVALALLGLLFCTPALYRLFRWKADLLAKWKPLPMALLFAAVGASLFWLLRMETYFLGDGAVYLAEHFRYVRGLPVSEDVLFSLGSAPLSAWLLAKGALLLTNPDAVGTLSGQPQLVFWLSGALLGAIFVSGVLLLVARVTKDGASRLGLTSLLLATPGTLFFFGYVEYYTLPFVLLGIYLLATMAVHDKRLAPLWLVVLFIAMCAAHIMLIVLLPGLLVSLISARGGEQAERHLTLRNVLLFTGGVLALGGLYYFVSGIATEGSRAILSLSSFGEGKTLQNYTLLSSEHLMDIVNMLLLVAAPAALLLVFIPWKGRMWAPVELVALLHMTFLLFLLLFGYTSFGMARDWDVNAGFGLAAAMFAFVMLQRCDANRRSYLLYLAAGASIVALLPWIAVNVGTETSVERFRNVMTLDDENIPGDYALNGYEHLRKHYQRVGEQEQLAWAVRKKVAMVGYPLDFRKLMLAIRQGVPPVKQQEYADWLFAEITGKLRTMKREGRDSLYEGTQNEYLELYAEFLLQLPQYPGLTEVSAAYARERLADLRAVTGPHPLAAMVEEHLRWEAGGDSPNTEIISAGAEAIRGSTLLCIFSARALLAAREFDRAERVLLRSLDIDDKFTLPYFMLGEMFATREPPDIDRAIHNLQLFLASVGDDHSMDAVLARRLDDRARHLLAELETLRFQTMIQ